MSKNRREDGGDRWVVTGDLDIRDGGKLLLNGKQLSSIPAQVDCKAKTVADVAAALNALTDALRTAGWMEAQDDHYAGGAENSSED